MSHISHTEVRLESKEAVEKMCELVPEFTFHDRKTFKSYGHENWPCDFAVSVDGAKYEIGFIKADGGLMPQVDWWPTGGLEKALGGKEMPNLLAAQNLGMLAVEAEREGFTALVGRTALGKFKLFTTKNKSQAYRLKEKASKAGVVEILGGAQ